MLLLLATIAHCSALQRSTIQTDRRAAVAVGSTGKEHDLWSLVRSCLCFEDGLMYYTSSVFRHSQHIVV